MDDKLFGEFLASMGEALEHAKGKLDLRTTVLPAPPEPMTAAEVRRLRRRLHASQAVFAHGLSVSTQLVQAWEAGRRVPEGPALKLLRLAEKDARVIFGHFAEPRPRRQRIAVKSRSHA